jgi:hypothetical protein
MFAKLCEYASTKGCIDSLNKEPSITDLSTDLTLSNTALVITRQVTSPFAYILACRLARFKWLKWQ